MVDFWIKFDETEKSQKGLLIDVFLALINFGVSGLKKSLKTEEALF